ncbi:MULTISPECIES: hypothetical protein [Enterococcus]|uniref:Uncharacterized protein n=1 Tax=Enterococcus casseliflavus TaxID=37734 RepID=A0ABD6YWQ1_ENTCA|nr:hypothetical protein [Enterococcus casseliflavus]EOH82978.1 hypothetical protein UAM_01808 [Enterococcus casseliflavus ATCC 49996]EOU10014.1 hypothetical protein I582_00519 [Enterococcus casseliflavus ATCC 49996]MBE9881093.1 hypothetical protein [Enterococcus casseliflavus]MCD5162345.1 hypothetical protein [Enterococcus casseliflavus]MCD5192873.1 hypothetical protein [Enterococcus casseliflavus]
MKPIRQTLYQSALYVAIPLIASLLIGYLAKCSLLIPASIIYGVLLVFMIPSDSFLSSNVDYQTKRMNPSFRPPPLQRRIEGAPEMINFLFVLTALVLCLLLLLVG